VATGADTEDLEHLVEKARSGDRSALERVVTAVQGDVYAVALRFLWNPHDAEDATQEILVRLVTRLSSFEGRSAFRTWAFRLATNVLLNLAPTALERSAIAFDDFAADLARGLSDDPLPADDAEHALLLEEVKIGCTHALLHCLDRDLRIAYVLGEILELDHREGAEVLGISQAAWRQRVSRARRRVTTFLAGHCGLFDPANPCRCRRRVQAATELGRVDPDHLRFATGAAHARRFPAVLSEIRRLEEVRRAAALYRSHRTREPGPELAQRLRRLLSLDGPEELRFASEWIWDRYRRRR